MAGIRNVSVMIIVLCYCGNCSAVNLSTTIECFAREFTFKASNPFRTQDGRVLPCMDYVKVYSCWGRCDSSEIADYKIPYKLSNHPVCTYGGKRTRTVRLRNCHPSHPDPTYEVFDATHCVCQSCNSRYTSCENFNG